jgi:hypothetical protein
MQLDEAIRILEALADGRDPQSGAPLPPEGVYQHPQVVRALYTAVQELKREEQRDKQTGATRVNAGKAWSAQEEADLLREFEAGLLLPEIAMKHGRTVAAIHGRLYLLGRMPAYIPPSRRV